MIHSPNCSCAMFLFLLHFVQIVHASDTSLSVFIDNLNAASSKLSDDIELIILGDLNVDTEKNKRQMYA